MADIRIKDLATTAASTASDDFLAVDGSANGTRKLNAFSPTFGGNVVATGTLTVNSTTDSSSKDTGAIITEGGLGVEKSATIGGNLTVSGSAASTIEGTLGLNCTPVTWYDNASSGTALQVGSGAGVYAFNDGAGNTQLRIYNNAYLDSGASEKRLTAGETFSQETISGEFRWRYAGSGAAGSAVTFGRVMTLFGSTGNLLVGSGTSDGGQKLQVAGGIAATGLVDITGPDNSGANGVGNLKVYAANRTALLTFNYQNINASGALLISTAGTTALTLDSSQNATFAGTVTSTGTLKAVTNLALTTVSGYNFIGFNNANNLTTATGIYSATGDTTLYLNVPTSSTIRARINGVDKLTVSETTATFANSIAIGNTVNTVSPTSPNRTITMVIGGTTYYIHAKTTND